MHVYIGVFVIVISQMFMSVLDVIVIVISLMFRSVLCVFVIVISQISLHREKLNNKQSKHARKESSLLLVAGIQRLKRPRPCRTHMKLSP